MTCTQRRARSLRIESLERREMFASIGYASSTGTVSIYGDDWNNDATVKLSGSKVVVSVVSTPSSGFSLVPQTVKREFSVSQVKKLEFFGGDGNDRFVSYLRYVPVYAEGGSGDDYIETYDGNDVIYGGSGNDTIKSFGGDDLIYGGSGNDLIYGGAGNDTIYGGDDNDVIYGGTGNDSLYGGNGNDKLYGEAGNDGLYGGAGTDELYGGTGADRFLVMTGHSEHKDAKAEDAVLWFKNGNKTWNAGEIEQVDKGLKVLHDKTGNTKLLKLRYFSIYTPAITFERHTSDGTSLADNNSVGTIRFFNSAFSSEERVKATTIHEMAHNWDTEHANWNNWMKISGWTSTDPKSSLYAKGTSTKENWWYLKTASFSTSYAKTNPREDWAESWQNYFVDKGSLSNIESMSKLSSAKTSHLDAFFKSLS